MNQNQNQNQSGNQAQTFPNQPFPSLPQVVLIPLAARSITMPSLSAPIPHSLDTLSEFINHMGQTLSQNGYQTNSSSVSGGEQTHAELSSNRQGLLIVEALSAVLHRVEQLLSGHAIAALSAEFAVNAGPAVHISPSGPNPIMVQVKAVDEEMRTGFLGIGFQPKWGLKDIPIMPKEEVVKTHPREDLLQKNLHLKEYFSPYP